MGLSKYKLGELIDQSDARNEHGKYTVDDVCGISTGKDFIETKANMDGVSIMSYKIVCQQEFAYVADTSRRGDKIAIAINKNKEILISSIYTVFRVCRSDLILPDYLFMFFNRPEFDRYARFNSWGSARETFNWEDMCDIDIDLPDLPTQQKYVDIYKAMVANQQSYERGLVDLKLVCDGYFDIEKKRNTKPLRDYIEPIDQRNSDSVFSSADVKGINNNKEFCETKADITTADITKFKVVKNGEFAYNSRTDGRDMLVLALNRLQKSVIVTFNYGVFRIQKDKKSELLPEYLYALFKRGEFDRRVRFCSWGSSQELLSWDNLCGIQIPIPDIKVQKAIAEVYAAYTMRKQINEQLKAQIKNICPILIKGSLEEE